MTRILVVDNYDSFVYTLNGYLQQLGAETEVVRNDSFSGRDAAARIDEYDAVLLSPGPGTPAAAGVSIDVVNAALEIDPYVVQAYQMLATIHAERGEEELRRATWRRYLETFPESLNARVALESPGRLDDLPVPQ